MDANLFPRVLGFNSRKSPQECGGHLLAAKVPKVCTFYRMTQILQHMQTFAGFRVYFARVYFAKCWESMQFCRITQVLQHTQTFAGSRVHFAKFHFAKCWEFMQFCRIYIVLQNLLKFAKVTQFCWIYLLAAAGGGCWRLWAAMGGYGRLWAPAARGGCWRRLWLQPCGIQRVFFKDSPGTGFLGAEAFPICRLGFRAQVPGLAELLIKTRHRTRAARATSDQTNSGRTGPGPDEPGSGGLGADEAGSDEVSSTSSA